MMTKFATRLAGARDFATFSRFTSDERGSMTIFAIMLFFIMIVFGGIAVDVMRFETRRVTLQQTMDRAALAAAEISQTRPAQEIFDDWFAKTGIDPDLRMVTLSAVDVDSDEEDSLRRVRAEARVRSYNYFMQLINIDYLQGPAVTEAAQGSATIEVIMVLDVSWSMNQDAAIEDDPATPDDEGSYNKIAALRAAAKNFVRIVKEQDTDNLVSIGIVPYNGQVKIPTNLRQQFTVNHLKMTNGTPTGVTNGNCFEIPQSTYGTTALSRTTAITMAAVADVTGMGNTETINRDGYVAATAPADNSQKTNRICNTAANNHVLLPTKNAAPLNAAINALTEGGYTSTAIGMRWATALLDETARPIYEAIGDDSVNGDPVLGEPARPADNDDGTVRKIVILMTDGDHWETQHIKDAYKSGPSPIYMDSAGRFVIRFVNGGPALTGSARPSCAGANTYFVPHLKTGSGSTCVGTAWRSSITTGLWTGAGTVRQLDWSEVWERMSVKYLARQIYGRSNVTAVTGSNYTTVFNEFVENYIDEDTLDDLLSENCTAAKVDEGMEVFGIALAAPAQGQAAIEDCSSTPKSTYYFEVDGSGLNAAFESIAEQIGKLRLTQ